ncbi:MAG: hydrolase [Cereibacter sphaeroides]|uniref:Hydrolase n=1 Tax=Cereibacter sphaeroides TaxID=1063 RepID=A0A2W5S786_CERSP|nr:MAG: hydrolase [Cereibacter sphaeroides]
MKILVPTSDPRMIQAGDLSLHAETFGDPRKSSILLVMGNSAPGLLWPDAFCDALAAHGFHVIRFDQRDTGLSSYLDYDTDPYTLHDLSRDALAVLDGLGIAKAHIVGMSQGGVLACLIARDHPDRAASLTMLMSSVDLGPKNAAFSGQPPQPGALSQPAADYVAAVIALNAAAPQSEEESSRQFVENFRLASGAESSFDEHFWQRLGRAVAAIPRQRRDRLTARMANNSNHRKAQVATPPFTAEDLKAIRVPALVLHGTADPIFPADHARWSAAALSDARLHFVSGMGHALDPAYFRPIADTLAAFLAEQDRPTE